MGKGQENGSVVAVYLRWLLRNVHFLSNCFIVFVAIYFHDTIKKSGEHTFKRYKHTTTVIRGQQRKFYIHWVVDWLLIKVYLQQPIEGGG